MKKIIFWNVERFSETALEKAERKAKRAQTAFELVSDRVRRTHEYIRPQTRAMERRYELSRGYGDHDSRSDRAERDRDRDRDRDDSRRRYRGESHDDRLSREERKIYEARFQHKKAMRVAEQYKNKAELTDDLIRSAPHVFYSEVVEQHSHAQSPRIGGTGANPRDLCYAYYHKQVSTQFTHCGGSAPHYNGANPILGYRMPKGIVISGMNFYFWHAPSQNDGNVVVDTFNGLAAAGNDFVLFGDLNSEPHRLQSLGMDPKFILSPNKPTRISGRCLDFALTNVPVKFGVCRPLYEKSGYEIKIRTGSDHMIMILEMLS